MKEIKYLNKNKILCLINNSVIITRQKESHKENKFIRINTETEKQNPSIINSKNEGLPSEKQYFENIYNEIIVKGIEYSAGPATSQKNILKIRSEKITPKKEENLLPKKSAVLYAKKTEMNINAISITQTPVNPNNIPRALIKYKIGPLLSKKSRNGTLPSVIPRAMVK